MLGMVKLAGSDDGSGAGGREGRLGGGGVECWRWLGMVKVAGAMMEVELVGGKGGLTVVVWIAGDGW